MDDTTVMIKVDFQDMQIIGMMHSVIVKNRAKCGVQEIRCQRLIVDIGQKLYTPSLSYSRKFFGRAVLVS